MTAQQINPRDVWARSVAAITWLQSYVQRYGVQNEEQLDNLYDCYTAGMSPAQAKAEVATW